MIGWIICQNNYQDKPELFSYVIKRYLQEANKLGIDLKIVNINEIDFFVSQNGIKEIYVRGEETNLPHFIIPYSASQCREDGIGTNYYMISLIRQFENIGVFVSNSSSAIEKANDKFYTKQTLAQYCIPIPKTGLLRRNSKSNDNNSKSLIGKRFIDRDMIEKTFGFPVIVKLLSSRKGRGVFLCENKNMFKHFIDFMFETHEDLNCIVQEYIADSQGRDIRVLVIGGMAIGAMQRQGNDSSFKSNMTKGAKGIYIELTDELKKLAESSAKALDLNVAGVDILFDKNGYKICEVNASPGFRMFESCNDINVAKNVLECIISKVKNEKSQS